MAKPENYYDHEQDEQDYYDRENAKRMAGCAESVKVFGIMLLVVIACFLLFGSCKTAAPPVAVPYGPVISIDGDQIEVAFEVVNKQKGSQLSSWFYVPGHRFVKGDIFPDFGKYKHPLPATDDHL